MVTPTIIEIRNEAPPVTYHPFTSTMLKCIGNNKINCIKIWREFHRLSPVAFDKNGKAVIPGLRSAKKVVEAVMREWDARRARYQAHTCRVNEDYNIYTVLDNEGETEIILSRKELA